MGVHLQKQEGLFWGGACVPAGRLQPDDFHEFARVAETCALALLTLLQCCSAAVMAYCVRESEPSWRCPATLHFAVPLAAVPLAPRPLPAACSRSPSTNLLAWLRREAPPPQSAGAHHAEPYLLPASWRQATAAAARPQSGCTAPARH